MSSLAKGLRLEAVCLHCVFLAAFQFVGFPRWIVAVTVVADSYGAAEEAGGPAEVAGTGVSDVVVAADGLLGQHGYRAGSRAAHDAVGAVGLVGHAGVCTWAHHVGARLFAVSLVHDLQVRVPHAAGHQHAALILVRLPVAAAHSMLP